LFTPDEIRWELETEHGFTAEEIPTLLGGCWTYDAFDAWLRDRMHYEQGRYFAGDHSYDVGTLRAGQNNDKSRAGMFGASMRTGHAYDSRRPDARRNSYAMGGCSKRSKRHRHPPGLMFQDDSEEREDEDMDGKPRAVDRKQQTRRHSESEVDDSFDDLMKQFQQLFFRDSSTTTAVLPKSSQQHSLAGPTSAHTNGQVPSSQSGWSEHQQQQRQEQQQRVATDRFLMSSTSPMSSPFMSRMNLLNPLALLEKAIDAIPINNKTEFITALQIVPHLVGRESDPMRYLVFHEYDAQHAAECLVYYWKIHCEWFGDQAYLPMAMSSSSLGGDNDAHGDGNDGALTTEDTCHFRSGFMVIAGTDCQGSPVLILDDSRENTTLRMACS